MHGLKFVAFILAVTACVAQKYHVTMKVDDTTYEGLVEVNVDKGEEIYRTGYAYPEDGSEPKTGLGAPYTVRDVREHVDALVDGENGVCYLYTYDADEEVSPEDLKVEMEESQAKQSDDVTMIKKQQAKIVDQPIDDVVSVSPVIGSHCADKTSYWMEITDEETLCDGAPSLHENAIKQKNSH